MLRGDKNTKSELRLQVEGVEEEEEEEKEDRKARS